MSYEVLSWYRSTNYRCARVRARLVHACAAVAFVLGVSQHGAVAAEPQRAAANADSSQYDELIRTALGEMESGNFAEARALFGKAHAMQPSARTLRGLGYVEFELKRYTQSVRYLRSALLETKRALEPGLRREVERMLERAEAYTGHFQLQIVPADAQLSVDGQAPEFADDGSLWLDVGSHELRASAPGYAPLQQRLNVSGGEHQPLPLKLASALEPSTARAASSDAATQVPLDRGPADQPTGGSIFGKWWFWTAVGVVVAGTVVGVGIAASGTRVEEPLPGNLGGTLQGLSRSP